MKIMVVRGGGFAGLEEILADVDTSQMPAETAHKVEQLVKEAHFFQLPDFIPTETVGADYYHYTVTVEQAGQIYSVTYLDEGASSTEKLQKLVQQLVD